MTTPLPSPLRSLVHQRHAVVWLGVLTLLLSLLTPIVSIQSADAAQTRTSQEACDPGFVLNEESGECEPFRPGNLQIAQECEDGTVRSQDTGECEPEASGGLQQAPPECREGEELHRETGECIPVTEIAVPETETPTEEATETPALMGYVQVIKRGCPEGFVPDDTTAITEFQNTCLDPIEGVLFHSLIGGVAHASVPTDATGLSQLGSAPVGEITLAEEILAGYGEPVVYCAEDYAFGVFEHTYTEDDRQPVLNGNAVGWMLSTDTLLQCYFYNIVTDVPDGPGDITARSKTQGGVAEQEHLVIAKAFRCPLGAPYDSHEGDLIDICGIELPDVEFTFSYESDESDTFTDLTNANGVVEWGGPPAGGITIQETIPDGYEDPYVFCSNSAPGDPEVWVPHTPLSNGLLVTELPEDPTVLECRFYNIPIPADPEFTVEINKHVCPPGLLFMLLAGDAPAFEDIQSSCVEQGNGISFTIDHASGSETLVTSEGRVTFSGVPGGPFTVTEEIPPGIGEPNWYCSFAELGMVIPVPLHMDTADGVLSDILGGANGGTYRCWVFNPPPEEDRNVTVWKWHCPAGLEPESEDLQAWLDTCDVHPFGIDFTVADANGEVTKQVNGSASWYGTAPGSISIKEHTPASYHEPYVFCRYEGMHDGAAIGGGPDMLDVTDSTIQASMPFNEYNLTCHFFNIPDETDNSITNIKYLCPAGYDFDAVGAHPPTDCTQTEDGVTFTLSDGNAPDPDASGQSGDDAPGTVIFDKLDPGTWTVTEELPPGIVDVLASCPSVGNGPVFYENPPRVEFDVEEGNHWGCSWFNVPEEPRDNTVEIRKWQCPEGTEYGQTQDWYEANCVQQHDGVEFTLTSDIGIAVQETAGGVTTFPGLPEATVGIQETIPEGFGPPIVFCGIEGDPQHHPAPTGYWEFDFSSDGGASDILVCLVYNIPGERPDVTIYKWTCPEGYDLNAAGADPKVDCTEVTNGVEFQFGPSAPAAVAELQTTGDVIDGGVVFDDLEPGTYKAVELVPDGIDHVFVLECTGHIMGVLQPYPLQMGNILDNIDVDAGEHLTCLWYNVPERDGEKLTLIKYICTTEVFVDEVDCETFEHGQTFDLLHWNTDDGVWEVIDTEVTDGVGMIVWTDLAPGDYGLDELDGDWCHLSTTPVFGPGDFFSVFEGEATVVKVYNCDPDWTTTTIPQKYPNTGMPQGALLQIDPTAEPGTQLQAAPTSTPSMPIRVAPTETPTPRVTEEPGSPGGLQANPTEAPPEDSDSALPLQAEPTQVPAVELPDDAGQLEIGATVYVTATVCDGVGFDPYTSTYWWGFIAGCPYPPNGWPVLDFEVTATDGAGFLETSSAEWPDDVVEFNVPAATVTVSTSIPDGFAEPVSLCIETGLGYSPVLNEPPPGVLLHTVGDSLTLDLAPGQGYSCAFYHVTEVPHSNAVTVHAWLCPQGTAQGMPLTDYLDACSDGHSDLGLTLYPFTGGPQATTTVEGMAHWDSVSMGQIILVMESPSGFDEPVVICGTTESPGGGIQHPALVPPDVQGNYRGVLEVPGAELVCHWFSMPE